MPLGSCCAGQRHIAGDLSPLVELQRAEAPTEHAPLVPVVSGMKRAPGGLQTAPTGVLLPQIRALASIFVGCARLDSNQRPAA